MTAPRVLHLFANYKWTGPADPAIRAAARLRGLGLDVSFTQAEFVQINQWARDASFISEARKADVWP